MNDKKPEQPAATPPTEAERLRALLIEARTALLTAGVGEDDLMNRIRAELAPKEGGAA